MSVPPDLPLNPGAVGGYNGTGNLEGTGLVGKSAERRVQGRKRYMALNTA